MRGARVGGPPVVGQLPVRAVQLRSAAVLHIVWHIPQVVLVSVVFHVLLVRILGLVIHQHAIAAVPLGIVVLVAPVELLVRYGFPRVVAELARRREGMVLVRIVRLVTLVQVVSGVVYGIRDRRTRTFVVIPIVGPVGVLSAGRLLVCLQVMGGLGLLIPVHPVGVVVPPAVQTARPAPLMTVGHGWLFAAEFGWNIRPLGLEDFATFFFVRVGRGRDGDGGDLPIRLFVARGRGGLRLNPLKVVAAGRVCVTQRMLIIEKGE